MDHVIDSDWYQKGNRESDHILIAVFVSSD